MHSASSRFLVVLMLFAVTVAHSQTQRRPASPRVSPTKPARPRVKITAQSLGAVTKRVSLPKVTEGAKRVLDLQAEHRQLAAVAQKTPAPDFAAPPPYVAWVNDRSFSSTWIVPGAPYVFKGKGFGTTAGEVKLLGGFPGKAPKFRIDLWQDTVIHAYLEDNISGALDQENVTLAVTAPGILVTRDGVKFFASRELRELYLAPYFKPDDRRPPSVNTFKVRTTSKHDGFFRVEGVMTWDVGIIVFGDPSTCDWETPYFKLGGTDEFKFPAFKPGWAAVGYEWYIGRVENGNTDYKGNEGFMETHPPDYEAELSPKKLTVKWATFNSLTTPPCFHMNRALASTFYEIKAYLEGPRGTKAF